MNTAVSVLIPAYNAENSILPAVWSALNQAFSSFEVLVYVDGATDKTIDFVAAIEDPKLKVFADGERKGIVHARNRLLEKASGKYIAWLDADDIMLPGRLHAQFEYLENHPDVSLLAGWAQLRNAELKTVQLGGFRPFLETLLLFRNPFIQSTIMARNFFAVEGFWFDPEFEYTEDYDMYLRCLQAGKGFGVLQEPVVSYYISSASEADQKQSRYALNSKLVKLMLRTHPFLAEQEALVILSFLRNNNALEKPATATIRRFLTRVKKTLKQEKRYSSGAAAALLYQQFRFVRASRGWFYAGIWLLGKKPALWLLLRKNRPIYR